MAYIIVILLIILIVLLVYLLLLQQQIKNMSRQLSRRLEENTRQPVSLELINSGLNQLAAHINQCLKAEETLRLSGIREEKKFKELIADISHDLRTPLTAIKGYLQLLDMTQLTTDQQSKLTVARKHTEELSQLIECFFEYSYLLNTEPELHLCRFNLTQLVTEVLIGFVASLEKKQLAILFDEDTPPIFVTADPQLTTRIVQNLMRNCMEHSEGDIMVGISDGEMALISFKNQVKQPKQIDVNRIFDRFYTGDIARSHSTGLGLAIVKLLTEQMNGTVSASMEENLLEIRVALERD